MNFNKHVRIREEKFGAVIFETMREKVFVTNGTGADIVRLIQEDRSPKEIADELAKAYGTDPDAIAADVNTFIDQLKHHQVLI